jgi:hypothetical protein
MICSGLQSCPQLGSESVHLLEPFFRDGGTSLGSVLQVFPIEVLIAERHQFALLPFGERYPKDLLQF